MKPGFKKYAGRNGTLVVGRDGVTIQRNVRQALQHRANREVKIRYQDIGEFKHHRAAHRPGYLQFSTKQGTEGVTSLNRVNKIHFNREDTHLFRRARESIRANIEKYGQDGQPHHLPDLVDSDTSHPPPAGNLTFRRKP